MELKDYVRIVLTHWVGFVVLTTLGVLLAVGYNHEQPKVYQSSASGLVTTGKTANAADASIGDSLSKSRVTSYVTIATSTQTAEGVINDLGLDTSPGALIANISVSQPIGTVLIDIDARAATPAAAAQLADAWVRALSDQVAQIEGTPKPGQQGLRMLPIPNAQVPSAPVLPRTRLNLLIGLMLGLLLGVAYALIRKQFDRRLRSTEEVEKAFGHPVIGVIPQSSRVRQGGDGKELALAVTGSLASSTASTAEAFRKLRTNLAFMDVDNPPRVIVVTSPKPSDGKSTVAANLAAAIAIGGQPVILIDGDLRRPTVASSLGLVDGAGLTDVLVGRVTAAEVLQEHPEVTGMRVLASGAIPPNPSELLGSKSMRNLVTELARDAMVIIDAPPLLPVTDAAVLTRSADGAIIVITHGGTLDSELTVALNHISTVHGRTLGLVFNRMRRSVSGTPYGGDYYRYEYKSESGRRKLFPNGKKIDSAARSGRPTRRRRFWGPSTT